MVLKVKELSVSYGEKTVVDKISFSLQKGEVLGILGENGAGKTSLVEAVLGIRPAVYKEVAILGQSPIHNRKQVFEKVGVQFQESHFPDKMTVSEACQQWSVLYKATAPYQFLLTKFGLQDKEKSLVKSLSGGEKQRLAVLLALLPNPELVFLDELTTGLDTKARKKLWQTLRNYKREGLSIVLTSHYMDEVEALCDRVMILKGGHIICEGTIAEVINYSGQASLEAAYLTLTDEEGEG
ncbi:ABC transporter ATP-binding protein [Cytobacillus kochii]|uniref:ABC transporter ATP-binding protein n=1 Tax=Cytobacillus kochii TaxID=859143 RepID=UPI001CD7861E|nr:ABC transporter ATP-binding protein [Cytobacillus kochii]MCA1028761.1 ABC transporter ATP-binding protein [Cytobacillus kochii]MCM3322973.1 ABC transporter ATP-binding protein [Cytobacillus kochii]MCM3345369.1 ABC transporter ATP-binding protein [Cytobacillus kochii]